MLTLLLTFASYAWVLLRLHKSFIELRNQDSHMRAQLFELMDVNIPGFALQILAKQVCRVSTQPFAESQSKIEPGARALSCLRKSSRAKIAKI